MAYNSFGLCRICLREDFDNEFKSLHDGNEPLSQIFEQWFDISLSNDLMAGNKAVVCSDCADNIQMYTKIKCDAQKAEKVYFEKLRKEKIRKEEEKVVTGATSSSSVANQIQKVQSTSEQAENETSSLTKDSEDYELVSLIVANEDEGEEIDFPMIPTPLTSPTTSKSSDNNIKKKSKSKIFREKKYKCNLCDSKYTTNCSLRRHFKWIHEKIGFLCRFCEQKFNTKAKLVKHVEIRHSIEDKFECKYCSCRYKTEAVLNGHISKSHPREEYPLMQF